MDKAPTTIGARIKILRDEIGLTQKELADKLEISKSTLGMYETNKREPNLIMIKKLCTELNTTGDYLIGFSSVTTNIQPHSPEEDRLLSLYNNLNTIGKKKVTEYIEDLAANEKYTCEEFWDKELQGA